MTKNKHFCSYYCYYTHIKTRRETPKIIKQAQTVAQYHEWTKESEKRMKQKNPY